MQGKQFSLIQTSQAIVLVCLLGQVSAQNSSLSAKVQLNDGSVQVGQFVSARSEKITLATQSGTLDLSPKDLRVLQFPGGQPVSSPGDVLVKLTGGSELSCSRVALNGQDLAVSTAEQVLSISSTKIVNIRLNALSPEQLSGWETIADSAANSDVAVLVQKSGALTKIEGIIESIGDDSIQFDYDGTVELPLGRVAGLKFFVPAVPEMPRSLALIKDRFNNQWAIQDFTIEENKLTAKLRCGETIELPLPAIREFDFSLGNMSYLADLELLKHSAPELFSLRVGDIGESKLFGVQRVAPKQVPGRTVGPSLLFLGSGEAVFEVPEGFQFFTGTVQLKPKGNKCNPCAISISLENKQVWTSELNVTSERKNFKVKIEGGQRLRLVVSSLGDVPSGDVVLWEEPKLLR